MTWVVVAAVSWVVVGAVVALIIGRSVRLADARAAAASEAGAALTAADEEFLSRPEAVTAGEPVQPPRPPAERPRGGIHETAHGHGGAGLPPTRRTRPTQQRVPLVGQPASARKHGRS